MWRVHVHIVSIGVGVFVTALGVHHLCVLDVLVFSFGVVIVVFIVVFLLVVVGFIIEDGTRVAGGASGPHRGLRRVVGVRVIGFGVIA